MKLLIGLGNPGKKYDHTRHNIGWDAVSCLADVQTARFSKKAEFQAEIAETFIEEKKVLLVHPLTFMNLSGETVVSLKNYYKCDTQDILIVQDEMDYAVGSFVFTAKNGNAGHNGIASIQQALATTEIARLRIGIGRPLTEQAKEEYVLEHFSKEEKKTMDALMTNVEKAMKDWVKNGTEKTMNTWNRKMV